MLLLRVLLAFCSLFSFGDFPRGVDDLVRPSFFFLFGDFLKNMVLDIGVGHILQICPCVSREFAVKCSELDKDGAIAINSDKVSSLKWRS